MNNEPREKLRELIVEYGRSLCDDPRRFEALLKDYCGQYKREIFVLVTALKNRVADDLLKTSEGVPHVLLLARLIKRLEDELAMTTEAAQWAVESWALALGVIQQPLLVITPAPAPPPTPPIIPKTELAPHSAGEILLADRYRDNGDGTVTDMLTDLQWMRFSLGQEWKNDTCVGEARKYTWQQALDAANTLNHQGGYAGCRDWRVPNKEELLTLVYCSSGHQRPTIFKSVFPNTPEWIFLSSSTDDNQISKAWLIDFSSGCMYSFSKNILTILYVRLVRGGP